MNFLQKYFQIHEKQRHRPPYSWREAVEKYNTQDFSSSPVTISTPPPPITVTSEEVTVIDIHDATDMEKYLAKLQNLESFTKFLQETPLSWAKVRLDRVLRTLNKVREMNNFDDDEFNFNLARKVRDITLIMLDIFSDAKNSSRLRDLVEEYLSSIGIERLEFNAGDSFDDWAALSMESPIELIITKDRTLNGTLKSVEIQPHVINYRNEHGEVDKFIFGGVCSVYKFKED